ncbi:MAG: hypothetical protein JW917_03825 [Ignavibacteria bacterium]|nr:hypothetical protein [Ignavibacteria bacterium]
MYCIKVVLLFIFCLVSFITVFSQTDSLTNKDPSNSRLLIAPSGKALDGGKGYFSVSALVPWTLPFIFPFFNIGLTDFASVGAGGTFLRGNFIYFAPQFTPLKTKNVYVSGGFGYFQTANFSDVEDVNIGFLYNINTFHHEKFTFSTGLGWFFNVDNRYDFKVEIAESPHLLLSAEYVVGKDAILITENWIDFNERPLTLFSLGLRHFGKNHSIDFSMLAVSANFLSNSGSGYFIIMPWITYSHTFKLW